jgi:hypothetical protein
MKYTRPGNVTVALWLPPTFRMYSPAMLASRWLMMVWGAPLLVRIQASTVKSPGPFSEPAVPSATQSPLPSNANA